MPIVNTNFVAGKMNKSVDERLVPPGQYVNAINVRLGSTETTEIGAVENSKGNTQLTTLAYGGQNLSNSAVCIGAYQDGSKETIYWFIHDANNPVVGGKLDLIVSFNVQSQAITYHVISKQVLNFDPKFLITGVNKIEDLLFWTDDKNPPRKINVTQNYPDPAGINDGIKETDISVILKPPGFDTLDTLPAPSIEFLNVPGEENYLETRFITFAYRYRYVNNEYSATSLFSTAAFQPGPFDFDVNNFNNASMKNIYNSIEVQFETGSDKVIEVDLLFKPSNSNSIYVIERFKKSDYGWANNSKQTYTFTNSKIYTVLGSDELLRLYDNVPKVAQAQTIQGNRLIYGNYTDGYDIINAAGQDIPINFTTSLFTNDILFDDLPEATMSTGAVYTINPNTNTTVQNSKISFDLSDFANRLVKGSSLAFTVFIQHSQLNGDTGDACYDSAFENTPFELSVIFPVNRNYTSVYEMVNSIEFSERIGTVLNTNFQPLATSTQGNSLTDLFNTVTIVPTNCVFTKSNSSIDSQTQQGFRIGSTVGSNVFSLQVLAMKYNSGTTDVYEYFYFTRGQGTFTSSQDTSSLHSNRDYETGIVYMDDYGRASTVLVSEFNTTFVPASASVDQNKIKVNIENYPPTWATKYKFVLKPSEGGYETIYSSFYYQSQTTRVIYFKLEGDNQNKVQKGDLLIVKTDASGPLNREVTCQVLDVSAESSNFLEVEGEAPTDSNQLAGLYMQIRAQNFSINLDSNAVIDAGEKTAGGTNRAYCSPFLQYPAFTTDANNVTDNYTIPAQSSVKIKWRIGRHDASGCPGIDYIWENTYVSSQDYDDLHAWFQGDFINPAAGDVIDDGDGRLQNPVFINTIATSSGAVQCPAPWTPSFQFWQATPGDAASPLYLACRSGVIACANGGKTWFMEAEIVVTRANNLIVWETQPADADPNLFYDSSEAYDVIGGYHMGGNGDGDQAQTATQDAIVTLPFFNCYTFGNGVESYKVLDALDGQAVNLGERVLAVSKEDFKEADRFAELTYSGIYSSNSNLNNLNEFNLGLVNFKDLETSFGPIMKLHSRETDILVLQEDKISYVLTGKNLISDSTGGGVIASVPQVLGTQIARIEEYGISYNPESFSSWGYDMYFTDTKRTAVIKLKGTSANNDALEVISDTGMRSWFRDQFNVQLNTQKLGAYDPYMDEYVLSTNGDTVPLPPVILPCGTQKSLVNSTSAQEYTIEIGNVIGNVVFDYTISSGTMSVSMVWDGTQVASVSNATTSGSLNFNKTKNSPTTVLVTVTPNPSADYDITCNCPTETSLVVVQVGISSSEDVGKFIHNEFKWNDANVSSPVASNMMTFGSDVQIASQYFIQSGTRSIGVYPYSGSNVTVRSNKINFDDYTWVVNNDNFAWLSSNTLYDNNSTDINALLAAATTVPNSDVNSPSSGLYQATISSINLPVQNQYLYLIYDYRTTNSASFCYDASVVGDACCGCGDFCTPYLSSTVQSSIAIACVQPASQTYYHDGVNVLPSIGDTVYSSSTCDDSASSTRLQSGYYEVGSNNEWIQVNSSGVVVSNGSCAIKAFNSSVNDPQISTICTQSIDQTYYHTGANAAPQAGDFCYSDQGQTKLTDGYYRISSTEFINLNLGTGQVYAVVTCPTVTYYPFNTKQQANPQTACMYSGVLDEVYYTTTGTGPSDGAGTTIYSDNTGTVATGIVLLYSVGTNGAANVWFGTDGSGDIDGNGLQNC